MRLDFNVLWVDDQPDRVGAQITAITKLMQEEGFHFVPTLCQSIDEVKKAIAADVFFRRAPRIARHTAGERSPRGAPRPRVLQPG